MGSELVIKPVTLETRAVFSDLLEEARAWQAAQGAEGWGYPFDDAWMLPRIERGELYLVYQESDAVGAFRLLWEDIPFWGERETGESVYLHTFAVSRRHVSQGLGPDIIERVCEIGRAAGRANVRLDCALSSTRLITFYERCGFISTGTIFLGGMMMNLMEREI